MQADQVILAIGQLAADMEVPDEDWVFVGGDVAGAGGTVTEAMASGRTAAEAIDEYLSGGAAAGRGKLRGREESYAPFVKMRRPTAFRDVRELTLAEGSARPQPPAVCAAERLHTSAEIACGVEAAQVLAEARRCMKYDRDLEAESEARLEQMGRANLPLSPDEDPMRRVRR